MKKSLFFCIICLGIAFQPLSAQTCRQREAVVAKVDNADAVRFIKSFYADCVFGTSNQIAILKKHCTEKLLKELKDGYGYDGEGYAIWNFRSGEQDGPDDVSKVMSVTALGNDTYKVNFIDMGVKGSRVLKIVKVSGVLKFDAIE